jgi:hypothetical protein
MRFLLILLGLALHCAAQLPAMPGKPIAGMFYASADDHATIYLNGQKVHQADYGAKKSDELKIKVGDAIVVQLKNDGGPRGFLLVFKSSDESTMINFRRSDFRIVPDLEVTQFTVEQFKSWQKIAKLSPRKELDLPFKNGSEWVWGEADKCILAAVVTAQMVSSSGRSRA